MKIRSSFVTNSSSSSFIIDKNNANTIDNCFQLIKMAYSEMLEKLEEVKKQINEMENYPIEYKEDRFSFDFNENVVKDWDNDKKWEFVDRFEDTFHIDFFVSHYIGDIGWLEKANTYDEYVEYWVDKIKNNKGQKYMVHAPFIITLLNEDDTLITNVMKGEAVPNTMWKTSNNRILDNVVGWYDDEIKTKESIIGNCCIYSKDGYIPYMVVNTLSKFSTHFCVHMG